MKQYMAIGRYILLTMLLSYPLCGVAASTLEITPKQRVLIAQERGIVTLPFTLNNRSNKTLYLVETIDLPAGWRQLSPRGAFSLKAGENTVRLLHLLASSEVASGRHTLTYRITSQHGHHIYPKQTITVVVNANSQLSIDVIDKPTLALAGETYAITLNVKNKGNTPLALTMTVDDRPQYLTSFLPKKLMLKPTESSLVKLRVSIPHNLKKTTLHTVKLSFSGDSFYAKKTVRTNIISRIPVGVGQYHTLSTLTGIKAITENGVSTLQTEFKARGHLDREGTRYIDLLLQHKTTNNQDASSLLSSSEQRLSYKDSMLDVHLGDRSFAVGGITDTDAYAKGVEVNFHPPQKAWAIRAFTAKESAQEDIASGATDISLKGAELSYQLPHNLTLSANVLLKIDKKNRLLNEKAWGLNAHWYQYDALDINFHYAQDKGGNAYRLQQNGQLSDAFHYELEVQRADTAFQGAIKDRKSESINSTYLFDSNKYIRLGLLHHKNNLSHNPNKRRLEENKAQFGLGYYFANDHRDSLYAESFIQTQKDNRLVSDLKQKNVGLSLDYKKQLNPQWVLNPSLRYQNINNQLNAQKSIETKQSLTLSYALNDQYQMGFNVDAVQFSDDKKNKRHYGLNAAAHLRHQQHLSGYWRHTDHSGADTFQLNYAYSFKKKGRMTLSVLNEKNAQKKNNTSYLLGLSVALDAPLYRYRDLSTIKGRVLDSKHHQAIANAIIQIAGQYAVSDQGGNYQFKSIQAGQHTISVDLSKVKKQNYLLDNEYKKIITAANTTKIHTILLSQGAGLTGNIIKYQGANKTMIENNNDKLSPLGGIDGLLVSLISTEKAQTVHKTLSLEGGYFNFAGIKAGKWTIQISDPKQQVKGFRLQKGTRLIQLVEGTTQHLHFKAIPFIKTVKKIGPSNGFFVSSE